MESVSGVLGCGVWKNLKIFKGDGDNLMIFWIKSEFWKLWKIDCIKFMWILKKRFYVFYGRVWN